MRLERELIMYVFFGVLTGVVNFGVYFLFSHVLGVYYLFSNVVAWFLSVLFAYVTNRIWVFESNSNNILKEVFLFFSCRSFSGLVDIGLLYFFVDILNIGDFISKIIVLIIVVILNYLFSKLLIFK